MTNQASPKRSPGRPRFDVDLDKLRRLTSQLSSLRAVANAMGLGIDTVRIRLRELGIWPQKHSSARLGRHKVFKVDFAQVIELREQGFNLLQIAKLLDVHYGTLAKHTSIAGIRFQPGGMPKTGSAQRARRLKQCAETQWEPFLDAACEEETLPRYL